MIADEKTRVTVTLSRGAAGAKVLQEPKLNLRNAGEIAASDFVSVQLDGGDAFDVKAVMPDRPQDLRTRDTGEWDFWVTPLAGGTHEIQIIVLLYDNIGYLPAAKFAKSVTVTVPFLSRITKFVQGWPSEFALLLIAGAGSILLAGWWDRRSKRSEMASAKRAEGQEIPPPPAKD
jgi:hypothetical protein